MNIRADDKIADISIKFKKIKYLKWILDINNIDNVTICDLKNKLDDLCMNNCQKIPLLSGYVSDMPKSVYDEIKRIVEVKDRIKLYKRYNNIYLKKYKTDKQFRYYESNILLNIIQHIIDNLNEPNMTFEYIRPLIPKENKIYLAFIYYITYNLDLYQNYGKLITQNIPQLVIWVKENKYKPIGIISTDECEILAGIFLGMNLKEMLKCLNLSFLVKNEDDITDIINNLPAKFSVDNIIQVFFRISVINPICWQADSQEKMVLSLYNSIRIFKDNFNSYRKCRKGI